MQGACSLSGLWSSRWIFFPCLCRDHPSTPHSCLNPFLGSSVLKSQPTPKVCFFEIFGSSLNSVEAEFCISGFNLGFQQMLNST